MALNPSLLCVSALCLWGILHVSGSDNNTPDCCLKVSSMKHVHINHLKGFEIQTVEDGCPIEAVVLITKRDVRLCAPPNAHRVKRLINQLKNLAQEVNMKQPKSN